MCPDPRRDISGKTDSIIYGNSYNLLKLKLFIPSLYLVPSIWSDGVLEYWSNGNR